MVSVDVNSNYSFVELFISRLYNIIICMLLQSNMTHLGLYFMHLLVAHTPVTYALLRNVRNATAFY